MIQGGPLWQSLNQKVGTRPERREMGTSTPLEGFPEGQV